MESGTLMAMDPRDLAAARDTAEAFLQAVKAADEARARALLLIREGESMDFKTMHESTASYELGPAQAEGDRVVVVAKITGVNAPPVLPIVLTRAGGAWKVDMGASMEKLVGGSLNELVQTLGTAMAKGMDALAQGVSEAFSPPKKPKAKRRPKKK